MPKAKVTKDPIRPASSTSASTSRTPVKVNTGGTPMWYKVIMFGLMLLGLAWLILYYLAGDQISWLGQLGPRNYAIGFAVSVMEEPSPDIKRGNVISTNPAAGSELKRGTQITLTVSSGKEMTDVPDVTNLTADEAIEELKKAGLELNPNVRRESSDSIEEGVITSQQPAGGTQIAKGSRIAITVSSGPEMVQVPSLVGLNVEQATATLSSLQLRSTVTSVDSQKPEGQVLAVAGENTDVESGTTIELRVSNGMLMNMPEITRQSPEEAEKALRDAGWNGRFVPGPTVPTGALVDDGLIGHQEVAAGETIRKDQAIGYNLWKFDAGKLIPQNNAAAPQADTVQPQNANNALRNVQRGLGL